MNKFVLLFICSQFCFSCRLWTNGDGSDEVRIEMVNLTNYAITYEIGAYPEDVVLQSHGHDTLAKTLLLQHKTYATFMAEMTYITIQFYEIKLYNLSDTSSYYTQKKGPIGVNYSKTFASDFWSLNIKDIDSVFYMNVDYNNALSTSNHSKQISHLTVTNELLQSIMHKDYTMLEKFKDYYSTPH